MPRAPSKVAFECEACKRESSPRHVRRLKGRCRHCHEGSWILHVQYTDTETEIPTAGLLTALAFGFTWIRRQSYTNQVSVDGVAGDVAKYLTEDKKQMAARVSNYMRLRDQQHLRAEGAESCRVCEALFMPTEGKPWTAQGYCSKSCATQDGVQTPVRPAPVPAPAATQRITGAPVRVRCPKGHEFEVPAIYTGCIRPCTQCGTKTEIP